MEGSTYKEFYPQQPDLQAYIKLYYIHQSDSEKVDERIVYFPNYTTTLNIYKDSALQWKGHTKTWQKMVDLERAGTLSF
ncbi:MAG: hypothetical protein AAFY71_16800 [Bacteroidota bacterium]